MLSIRVQNVNEALPIGMLHLRGRGATFKSRGMAVVEYPTPVATTYAHPDECVLFDPVRDANPFFHFFEALWLLSGAEDVKPLANILPRILDYSDDGIKFHGAYGHRLRHAFGFDQLNAVIKLLREQPDTRRAVVSLYHPTHDLNVSSLDIPCNDMLMFSIRDSYLNLTVCNRSNDVVWGAYGANAVQFAFVLMYVAAAVNAHVGTYTQFSNNFHVYEDNPYWQATVHTPPSLSNNNAYDLIADTHGTRTIWPFMAHNDGNGFLDGDIKAFIDLLRTFKSDYRFSHPLINSVAMPMYQSFRAHKQGLHHDALTRAGEIQAADWRIAVTEWLLRRYTKKEAA